MSDPSAGWSAPDGWGGAPAGAPPGAPSGPPSPPAAPAGAPPAAAPPAGGWQAPPGWGGPAQAGGWGHRPPELKPGIVPLRPLGLGEVLDGAVGVLRRYPRATLGLSAVIALVTTLLQVPFLLATADSPLFDPTAPAQDVDAALGGLVAGFGVSSLLTFLGGAVLAGIITAVVGRAVLGQPMSLGDAWGQVRPLVGRLVGLAVLVAVLVYGGVLLLVALGVALAAVAGTGGAVAGVLVGLAGAALAVVVYVRLALAPSALVLERIGVGASLRRSSALVKGDWWRVFGILLLTLVIVTFVSGVLQTPFQVRSFLDGFSGGGGGLSTTDVVLQSIGSIVALTLVAPFQSAVTALLYVDRRMRAEGLDVALAAAAAPPRG